MIAFDHPAPRPLFASPSHTRAQRPSRLPRCGHCGGNIIHDWDGDLNCLQCGRSYNPIEAQVICARCGMTGPPTAFYEQAYIGKTRTSSNLCRDKQACYARRETTQSLYEERRSKREVNWGE